MKVKALNLAIAASLAITSMAYADSTTDQLNQLQAQVDQLKTQVGSVYSSNGRLSKLEDTTSNGAFTDYNSPFGLLPDTGMAYTLLTEQNMFTAPVVLGGLVELDPQAWRGDTIVNTSGNNYETGSGLFLTGANIYVLGNINKWVQAFGTLKGGTTTGSTTQVSTAFLNFGNLNEQPIYATLGKTFVPFGVFNGNSPWSNTLITNAFRSGQITQADLGFAKNGLNTNVAVFSPTGFGNNISAFSVSAQYGNNLNSFVYSFGAGYINDIRGTGSGVGSAYVQNGQTATTTSPLSGKKVAAYDLNTTLGYTIAKGQTAGLTAEWISTSGGNVTVNNGQNVPNMKAWDLTANYTPTILGKATIFALGYSATQNMQNVPLPLSGNAGSSTGPVVAGIKNQWLAFVSRQVVTNVYVGPEFEKAKLYNGQSTWTTTVDVSAYF